MQTKMTTTTWKKSWRPPLTHHKSEAFQASAAKSHCKLCSTMQNKGMQE
jgi:hypothetical protein